MDFQSNREISSSLNKKRWTSIQKVVISGLIIAMYIVVMYFTRGFAFGQYQIRIATSLYSLAGIFPFIIFPMGIANSLSNILMGGFGLLDMAGGFIAGVITCSLVYYIKRWRLNDWYAILPIIFIPGLLVPVWLSILTNTPYRILAVSISIGQIIPGIVGVLLLKQLSNIFK